MLSIRKVLYAAGLALALAAASHTSADAQASVARWRGTGSEQLIDQAVRRYGYRPNRLTDAQVHAINRAWVELLGSTTRRPALNRAQATAIVYLALVEPTEDRYAGRDRDRDDDDRPGYGGGYGGRPGAWSAECDEMEADAYRLGTLVSAPRNNSGLFVDEPERGRARALAREIQERAVQCRATAAADRAGEVLAALSDGLPRRGAVENRVNALKLAIREAAPSRRGR
ncbi:MAG TPA: hypothetical protein VLK84_06595 [Longimicrobium sp.]|nr:hypothetical protein [Longimicrobium sp.]